MNILLITVALIIAYLIGSISSAIIVCKIQGLPDPRTEGSKNAGATNVARIGNKKTAIIVLAIDVFKGILSVLIAKLLGIAPMWQATVALLAVTGHIFPIYFNFRGGKGVATAVGSLLALSLVTGLLTIGVWIIVATLFRYSSLASLTGAASAPILVLVFSHAAYVVPVLGITALIVWKHQANILRLLAGTEPKLGKR